MNCYEKMTSTEIGDNIKTLSLNADFLIIEPVQSMEKDRTCSHSMLCSCLADEILQHHCDILTEEKFSTTLRV
jgi:hypothetical protein